MTDSNGKKRNKAAANTEIVELITSLLLSDGSLSEGAIDRIRVYLAADKDEEVKRRVLQEVLQAALRASRSSGSLPFSAGSEDIEKGWERLAKDLGLNPNIEHYRNVRSVRKSPRPLLTTHPQHKPARRSSLGRVALRIAAVLLPAAMVVGGYIWYEWNGTNRDVTTNGSAVIADSYIPDNSVAAPSDGIRNIILPDGTVVTLNRNAILSYNNNREAELSGEAFFMVAKDPEHPFVIHSDHLEVTVLGTEFNFETSNMQGQSKLSLYEGVVELGSESGTDRLDISGTEFTLDNTTGQTRVSDFDTSRRPEWIMAEEISSDIMSLGTILDLIEAEYGVAVTNRDAVDTNRRFKFVVDRSVPLDKTMSSLEYLNGEFAYTINGTTVTLTKKQLK